MKIFLGFWFFILGCVLGSFLACMGYRIPNKIKTTYPSSFCPYCKKPLKWYMNIPIFSYIFLKGRCFYCKKKIGSIYFICELLCGVLFLVNYLLFGISQDFFIATILVCALIVTIVSDFEYYYISDRVIVISYLLILITLIFYLEPSDILVRIISSVLLFLIMYGIKLLGYSMFHKESLGDGDIKLMSIVGLSLGLLNSFISLFFSSVIALIFSFIFIKKNKDNLIPFGPFLLIGALIVIYFSKYINPFVDSLL